MKRLILILALMSLVETVSSQIPMVQTASSRVDFSELQGDQVLTRVYKGSKITHFRHADDNYKHSFMIQGDLFVGTKRIIVNINSSLGPDTLYRLNVNDMRIEGDSCYFCGNVVRVGPPQMTPQGNTIWPERDPVGFVGFFSVPELISGRVNLRYKLFYEVYDLTRLAVYSYHQNLVRRMVAAIGTLADQTTPCVLEITRHSDGSWRKSLGYPNSENEVFSDILYNPKKLVVASYRRCNGDEGEYQYEPNHWKFTIHYASSYGFCSDYGPLNGPEAAAEYDTYGLPVNHNIGWHISDVQLRLCRLAADRMCLAYGTKMITGFPAIILFSMPNEPITADTITYFHTGYSSAIVYDMVGLHYDDNSVAMIASGGVDAEEYREGYMYIPTISTSMSQIPFVKMYGILKRSVDRVNLHTAVTSGYQSVDDNYSIASLLQDKNAFYPIVAPPITCFTGGCEPYYAVGSLYAEKGEYEWNPIYKEKYFEWRLLICEAVTVNYENTCNIIGIFPYNKEEE